MKTQNQSSIRSLTEILKDADSATEVYQLEDCWNEIFGDNLKKYPLIELEFAKEHLEERAKAMAREHCKGLDEIIEGLKNL